MDGRELLASSKGREDELRDGADEQQPGDDERGQRCLGKPVTHRAEPVAGQQQSSNPGPFKAQCVVTEQSCHFGHGYVVGVPGSSPIILQHDRGCVCFISPRSRREETP